MSMGIEGGITEYYGAESERYETSEEPYGRKVRFTDRDGHDYQRETARKHFQKDQILTVAEIWVGGSSSTVEFLEAPNERFNTVMFEDVGDMQYVLDQEIMFEGNKAVIWDYSMRYNSYDIKLSDGKVINGIKSYELKIDDQS